MFICGIELVELVLFALLLGSSHCRAWTITPQCDLLFNRGSMSRSSTSSSTTTTNTHSGALCFSSNTNAHIKYKVSINDTTTVSFPMTEIHFRETNNVENNEDLPIVFFGLHEDCAHFPSIPSVTGNDDVDGKWGTDDQSNFEGGVEPWVAVISVSSIRRCSKSVANLTKRAGSVVILDDGLYEGPVLVSSSIFAENVSTVLVAPESVSKAIAALTQNESLYDFTYGNWPIHGGGWETTSYPGGDQGHPNRSYSRTVVFAIMCLATVAMMSVYCRARLHQTLLHQHMQQAQAAFFAAVAAHIDEEAAMQEARNIIPLLPVRTLDAKNQPDGHCSVCLDTWAENDELRTLPCLHEFHSHCIDPWLESHRTCPLCARDILQWESQPPDSNFGRENANSNNNENSNEENEIVPNNGRRQTMWRDHQEEMATIEYMEREGEEITMFENQGEEEEVTGFRSPPRLETSLDDSNTVHNSTSDNVSLDSCVDFEEDSFD
eukprot:m.45829 g.45829  ORF g.45829 m.45829 type:complete len:492 (-) comp10299_c0_seq1:1484-2959(-)